MTRAELTKLLGRHRVLGAVHHGQSYYNKPISPAKSFDAGHQSLEEIVKIAVGALRSTAMALTDTQHGFVCEEREFADKALAEIEQALTAGGSGMMSSDSFPKMKPFEWKELHKQVGQMFYVGPTDSDFQEGYFMEQVYFRTAECMYLLMERDIREPAPKDSEGK